MTAITDKPVVFQQKQLVKHENEPKKASRWSCCKPKKKEGEPVPRRKHSRQFTQHEIDYTIQLRGQAALKKDKSKVHVYEEPWDFTDTKVVKVETKKS